MFYNYVAIMRSLESRSGIARYHYEDEREMILTSVRNAVCKGNQI